MVEGELDVGTGVALAAAKLADNTAMGIDLHLLAAGATAQAEVVEFLDAVLTNPEVG